MSDPSKLNLEELKKSFPSLDDHSAKKLLVGEVIWPRVDESTGLPDPNGSGGGPGPSGFTPTGPLGPCRPTAGGGVSDYFGINDATLVDIDDFGWAGWGGDGPGGDSGNGSKPGESGNDQNPGGQQAANYSNLQHINTQTPSVNAHRTYSSSSVTLYGKGENGDNRVTVAPGGYTDEELDAFKVGGFVFKVVDRYGTLLTRPLSVDARLICNSLIDRRIHAP